MSFFFFSCLDVLSVGSCILISFFFFKQKTAYEMRISDWSSDVCSSDLLQDNGGRARNGIHEVSDQFVKFLLIGAFVVREHVKHLNDEVDPLRRAVGQIGRASCRERVCQYV